MDYCASHPEELSKVAGLQKKVEEVKGIMVDNIEQVHHPLGQHCLSHESAILLLSMAIFVLLTSLHCP